MIDKTKALSFIIPKFFGQFIVFNYLCRHEYGGIGNRMNEQQEYKRIKRSLYTSPFLDNELLLKEIESFGKHSTSKKLYRKLLWKYRWHRLWFPNRLPLGKAPEYWQNSQQPLVTVIVPNYCHAPYLKERIDCILNQTFQNFEVILLDDCSSDGSSDILLSYRNHPKVSHVVINEKNSGNTFLQWDKGVALAKGQYIWIAESDDYADESFLDAMMAVYYMHPDCVMVRGGSYQTNERGRVIFRNWDYWREDGKVYYFSGKKYIRRNMLRFNYIYNASMVVFRKDVFQCIDKSYQKLRYAGDWQCWIELLECGPIGELRRKLNYFRQHSNKVSSRSYLTNKGFPDQFRVLAYVLKHVRISLFRRLMIRGEMYETYLRSFLGDSDSVVRESCFRILKEELEVKYWHLSFYRFFRSLGFRRYVLLEREVPKAKALD